jgi:hypothetical protein
VAGGLQATGVTLSSIQFSDELRLFLKERMSSVDQIEIVLLLLASPEKAWTAPEVAETLKMAPESTAMRLFLLASAGLIVFEAGGIPRYRYSVTDQKTDRLLRELIPIFAQDRGAVLQAIEAPAAADPLRTFADAFKLKR